MPAKDTNLAQLASGVARSVLPRGSAVDDDRGHVVDAAGVQSRSRQSVARALRAAGEQVAPAVTDMTDPGLRVEDDGDDRGRAHAEAAGLGLRLSQHRRMRLVQSAGHDVCRRRPVGPGQNLAQPPDRQIARDVPGGMPAHPVGDREDTCGGVYQQRVVWIEACRNGRAVVRMSFPLALNQAVPA